MQNWGPISWLNVDLKIKSKDLSEKLKKVLPDLISSQQTSYIKSSREWAREINILCYRNR